MLFNWSLFLNRSQQTVSAIIRSTSHTIKALDTQHLRSLNQNKAEENCLEKCQFHTDCCALEAEHQLRSDVKILMCFPHDTKGLNLQLLSVKVVCLEIGRNLSFPFISIFQQFFLIVEELLSSFCWIFKVRTLWPDQYEKIKTIQLKKTA